MSIDYPLSGFYFSVRVDGDSCAVDAAFQTASGLSKEIAIEEVVSGGENRFKYRLPGTASYPNLVLKRGIVDAQSDLIGWVQTTLDSGLGKPVQAKNISLNLLDLKGRAIMSWSFVKAYPVKWSVADLNSQESSVLIETLEFAYRYFDVTSDRDNEYAGVAQLFAE